MAASNISLNIHNAEQTASSRTVQKIMGRFLFEEGIEFSVVNDDHFKEMINCNLEEGQEEFKIPTCQELKGWIFEEQMEEIQQYVNKIKESWADTGCSILLDEWDDSRGRKLVNFLVECPEGVVYLRSSDISALGDDADALQSLFDEAIKEVGEENVVQVIASSPTKWTEAFCKQFMERHKTMFWTISASHCIGQMLLKIEMMEPIKGIIDKAKTITKFVHSRATIFRLLRDYSYDNECNLVVPSKIKEAMPFLTLENIVKKKQNLKGMFSSSWWNTSIWATKHEGIRVADLVKDSSFWERADMVLKATMPLVNVLSLVYGAEKPLVGFIYETIDEAKETIKEKFENSKSQYMPLWKLIDEIWNNYLHSPLHSTGYYLNPYFFYAKDFHCDAEVSNDLMSCTVRMIEDQEIVSHQLRDYRHAKGAFEEGISAIRKTNDIPPAIWWSHYGGQWPELQRYAMRVLSQTCDGASKYRLKRHLTEKLLTHRRNPIEKPKLEDLVFVHCNLQLKRWQSHLAENGDIVAEEIDPKDDWIVDYTRESEFPPEDTAWMDLVRTKAVSDEGGPSSSRPKRKPR